MPTVLCPSCDALLTATEAAEDQCPSCGQSLESLRPATPTNDPAPFEPVASGSGLIIHKVWLGFIPIGRFCYCARCEDDLTHWVDKQSPEWSSPCPRCGARIDALQIAEEHRQSRIGCAISFASALLLLIPVAMAIRMLIKNG